MNVQTLSQWQFAITSIYHFFFVPLTIGLSVLVAIMETRYVRSGQEVYKRMAQFWGRLFLINFAMGVVTGIVQEFHFGMNWSEYSRLVGDIFGAPLAIEALLAFFLESIFLGIWIFGWEKLSKGVHLTAIWLVAFGSTFSAMWILIANSWMQNPVAYTMVNGRAVMTSFKELITNPYLVTQFPHTILAGFTTAAFFVLGISAYHLLRKTDRDFFQKSFRMAAIFAIISSVGVALVGHQQMQRMVVNQPMKVAAAEALWEGEDPASLSLFSIVDEEKQEDIVSIRIPYLLSLLSFNRLSGRVEGIKDLQADYEAKYGPGDYSPSVPVAYWTFRIMVGVGVLMILIALYALFHVIKKTPAEKFKLLGWIPFAIILPYLANTTGWMLTEMGRQPWVVFGVLKTQDAFSPTLTTGMVLTTLIGFTVVYGMLMVVDIFLLRKYALAGPSVQNAPESSWS